MAQLNTVEYGPRLYQSGAGPLPSVTECLRVAEGNWMNAWLQKVGRREVDRVMGEAAVLGKKIHGVAEKVAHDRGYEPTDRELAPYAVALREFFDAHVRKVHETELALTSERMGFAGTLDLYCTLHDGSRAVVDFKSSSGGVTKIHRLQTAGYALLLREHGRPVNRRVVVRLHKDPEKLGQWYARSAGDHAGDARAFMACVALWHFLHGSKLKEKKGA